MSNLTKLDFEAHDISGKNYLAWALDAEIHLNAKGHGDIIKEGNKTSDQEKAKAMIFLRHHLHEDLKNEYLTIKDPQVLWNNLKERYEHQKTIILPKARYEWMHLRLQDFKSVTAYNSAVFRITSQLKLCGEKVTDVDMLEKTFSIFHASNVLLQQQYREKGFQKYSDLISCLLVAEQNNELLMKNHEARPTGTAPFPEVNVATHDHYGKTRGRGQGRGRSLDRSGDYKNTSFHHKLKNARKNEKGGQSSKNNEGNCYRCGGKGHWSRTCRTPKHLVDLYQQSLKNKDKKIESHFACDDDDFDYGNMDVTHLDVADFLADPDGKIDHLMGDGSVQK
ncbi:ARM REPEAT PROTEIN INTERACTING WITH ABF2 [Trifolium repens]|nr:ARM REPEAT PROTEIN INTERACTING WITH ABF2 [Trifolium repens]